MLTQGFHWLWRSVLWIFCWLWGFFVAIDNAVPLQIEKGEEADSGLPDRKRKQAPQEQADSPGRSEAESVAIRTVPSANANAMGNAGSAEIVSNQIIRRREVLSPQLIDHHRCVPRVRAPVSVSRVSIIHNYMLYVCPGSVRVEATMNIKHAIPAGDAGSYSAGCSSYTAKTIFSHSY